MDGKDYLNSREGFLFMYEQGVRLLNWIFPGHPMEYGSAGITGTIPWDSGMATEKVLTEKEFRQSKIYGKYTPMTLEDFSFF